jgi:endoglucanase
VLSSREKDKPIPYDKLLIDAGLCPEEAQTMIRTGDLITMRRDFVELEGGLVSGKALDNRASVAACAVCMEELQRVHHDWDVYAVATTQEEVGLKGAITSAYGLEPDVGIAVDVTWADQPGAPEEYTYQLGKGPTIACGPNFHPRLQEALVETARALEMSYQVEPVVGGGSDAWAIQVTREGIPTALLSIPLRNMHSPVETVSIQDIKRVGRLLAAFVGALDRAFLDSLAWKLGLEEEE